MWFRSRRIPPPNNNIGIYTRGSLLRASDTSVLLPRRYNRRTPVQQGRTIPRPTARRNEPHHRNKLSGICNTRNTRTVPLRKKRDPDNDRRVRKFLRPCRKTKFQYAYYISRQFCAVKYWPKDITCVSLRIPSALMPSFVRLRRALSHSPIARTTSDGPSVLCRLGIERNRT